MWTSIIELLAKLVSIGATWFSRKNEPDMLANERARMKQEAKEQALQAVASKDINQIRTMGSK